VQQVSVAYLPNGYWFYVAGEVPAHKDPEKTDRKIIGQYGIDISRSMRARRKRRGLANLHYLRYGHSFVILATHGRHEFFHAEGSRIRDVRERPLHFFGYSISYHGGREGKPGHTSVRIDLGWYRSLKAQFLSLAAHQSEGEWRAGFQALPFEPYAPVRSQFLMLLRAVNRKREEAGLELVPLEALRLRRKSVSPFAT
jgi:hypothetical protein